MLIGLVIGSIIGLVPFVLTDPGPPVHVRDVREIDGVAVHDGRIEIVVLFDRLKDCPATTERWLWTWIDVGDERTKLYVPLGATSAFSEPGSNQSIVLSIAAPAGLAAGNWFYYSRTTDHCRAIFDFAPTTIRESPNVPIRILDPASAR